MEKFRDLMAYFREYDLYSQMLAADGKDGNGIDISAGQCSFAFLQERMEWDKINRILALLKGKKAVPGIRKNVQAFVSGEISLGDLFQTLSLRPGKTASKLKEDVAQIAKNRAFTVFYPVFYNKTAKKQQPLLTFSCELKEDHYTINRMYLNKDLLSLMAAETFGVDFSDTREVYRRELDHAATAIDALRPSGSFEDAYLTASEEWEQIFGRKLSLSQDSGDWQAFSKARVSFTEAERSMDSCFREELETVQHFCEEAQKIPDTLRQYLGLETSDAVNVKDTVFDGSHWGSYQENYPVNRKQWELVQMADSATILCVDGPPGTGKTTLLKEIIADTLVQKAHALVQNWDAEWEDLGEGYRHLQMCPVLEDNAYSIIISSTNNKAIDNIGIELLREIPFFSDFMQSIGNPEGYRGSLCARLGDAKKRDAFYETFYQPFCDYLREKEVDAACAETAKVQFRALRLELGKLNGLISAFLSLRKKSLPKGSPEELDSLVQKLTERAEQVQQAQESLKHQQSQAIVQHMGISANIRSKEQEKADLAAQADGLNQKLRELYADLEEFLEIRGIKKHLGFLMPSVKALQEKYGSAQQIRDLIDETKAALKDTDTRSVEIERQIQILHHQERVFTEQQNARVAKIKKADADYKHYTRLLDTAAAYRSCVENLARELHMEVSSLLAADAYSLRNAPKLVHLRHRLFESSLAVFEQYILQHREPILQNLGLFLSKGDYLSWCPSQFNGNDPYPEDKAERVRMLWKTFFLCFPVLTTTLHSFRKKVFQMIPGLFDLLLVDESGQILPYYVAAPLYRAKRAILVGDVNQIEPIRNVPEQLLKERYENRLGPGLYDRYCINTSSAQSYAALAGDYCETVGEATGGVILNEHRRCEPGIMAFSNEYIYSGVLTLIGRDDHDKLFGKNLVAFDIRGFKEKQHYNSAEIEACKTIVELLRQNYGDGVTRDIGIITPFKRQADKLKAAIPGVDIGTVHVFQGAEKKYILFSSVIDSTADNQGLAQFIGGQGNLLNVAFSRAKKQFIFVGNLLAARNSGNFLKHAVETIEKQGSVFSLFDMAEDASFDEKVLRVLAGAPAGRGSGKIDLYLQANLPHRVIDTPQLHNMVLTDLMKLAEQSINIISPWIGRNVVTDDFLALVDEKLRAQVSVHITFGHRAVNCSLEDIDALVEKDVPWNKAGAAEAIRALKTRLEDRLRYLPPSHVKLLLIDDKYLFIGSLNWLYNSGKTEQKELSCLVTNSETVRYVKERFLE